jgi:hypothetical protein
MWIPDTGVGGVSGRSAHGPSAAVADPAWLLLLMLLLLGSPKKV